MFSYYGSKSRIVKLYPSPKFEKVIEPFAGSARYALRFFDKDVLLVDKYPVVVEVWQYLQQASESDILGLPFLQKGEAIPESLSDTEKLFMGFIVADGAASPQKKTTSFSSNPNKVEARLKTIAKQLFKIRHWKIMLGSYEDLPNTEATWFIDPPYQFGGEYYKHTGLNYAELAKWCLSRNGQVIVCENTRADWLPFSPMKKLEGQMYKSTEALWSNLSHDYLFEQQSLFTPPNTACSGRVARAATRR